MNSTQLKYVKDRIRGIYTAKQREITKTTPNHKYLDAAAKLQALKDGRFTIDAPSTTDGYFYAWNSYVHFDEITIEETNNNIQADRLEALETEYNRLLDKIYLGDANDLLEAIQAFEKFETK